MDIIVAVFVTAVVSFLYITAMKQNARATRAEAALRRVEGTLHECELALMEALAPVDTSELKAILNNWRAREVAK